MTERKLVPHIRFKGLEEEWETKKLEEFSKIVGGGTPDTNKTDYWNGSINWYSPTEIGKKPYVYSSNKKITELGLKKSAAKIHPANTTILFTSRAGIGDMAILKKPAATNQGFQSIELNDNVSPYFIYSYGFMIKNKAERLASGSTFLEISKRDMKRIALKLPTLKEQQKIGNLFAKLDRLLDLQQQKLDQLGLLKKALLQKLFPKQGTKIPELRFKGFEGEWKRTRIKNIVQYSSSSFSLSELKKKDKGGTYPVYDAAGTKYYSNKFDMHDDYIAIIKDGSNVGKTRLLPAKTSVLSTMGYLKALNSNIFFDFYSITNTNFDKYKVGSGIPHIYFSDYKKECKLVPKILEQQKIGNLLAKVDRLIELENNKSNNLKQVKKSLLQNMFVE